MVIPPVIRYLDPSVASNGTGQSWASPYRSLDIAIGEAPVGTEIWVKRGSYDLTYEGIIALKPNVSIVGGFVGTETQRSQRVLSTNNPTVLTARLSVDASAGSFAQQVLLDGITLVQPSNAPNSLALSVNDSGGTFVNCTFRHSGGQAVYISGGFPTFESCTFADSVGSAVGIRESTTRFISCNFTNNRTSGRPGAAIDGSDAGIFLDRCTFIGNQSAVDGGAISNYGVQGSLTIVNSLFVNNRSRTGGAISVTDGRLTARNLTVTANRSDLAGAIHTRNATVSLINSILWGNKGLEAAAVAAGYGLPTNGTALREAAQFFVASGNTPIVRNNIIEGLSKYTGNNNIASSPLFSNALFTPYSLTANSPAIGTADLAQLESVWPTAFVPGRLIGGTLDMGAAEFSGTAGTAIHLTATPTSVSVYDGASPTFTVSGAAGVGPNVVWERLNGSTWEEITGSDWQKTSNSTSATLMLNSAQSGNIGSLRFRITGSNYTSPAFAIAVQTRRIVYVNAANGSSGNGSSWASAFRTIEEALALTDPGIDVRVAAGTYLVSGQVYLKPGMRFLGGFPANGSITDPALRNPSANVARIRLNTTLYADGRTGELDSDAGFDGITFETLVSTGIYIDNGASPRFRNCVFQAGFVNTVAIETQTGASPLFDTSSFKNNLGSLFSVRRGSSPRIVKGTFTGNQTTAIRVVDGSLAIEESTFDQNPLAANSNALVTVSEGGDLSVARSRFTANSGERVFSLGSGTLTLADTLVARNLNGAIINSGGQLNLRHVTLVDNQIDFSNPAGIYLGNTGAKADIQNSILWRNRSVSRTMSVTAQQIQGVSGTSLTVNYSMVEVGDDSPFGGTDNYAHDPLFADPDAGNYSLTSYSPANNSANPAYSSANDIDGAARNGAPDRGAFEFAGTALPIIQLRGVPTDVVTFVRNTASFTVRAPFIAGAVQWWRWDGSQRVALPSDPRIVITGDDHTSTLSLTNVDGTDTGSYVFTLAGTSYQSPVYTITPQTRLIRYVFNSGSNNPNLDGLSWNTAWRTLADALRNAPEGAEIWVMRGTYRLDAAITLRSGIEFVGGFTSAATLRSQRSSDASLTIIDGLLQNYGTTAKPIDATAVMDGFTLTYPGSSPIVNRDAAPTFRNCIIRDSLNGANIQSGGGTFENCIFSNISAYALSTYDGSTTIVKDSTFTGNLQAVRLLGGKLVVSTTRFHGNGGPSAAYSLIDASENADVIFDRSQFYDNVMGPLIRVADTAKVTLRNSLARDNATLYAGVFDVRGGEVDVIQSTIYANRASNNYSAGITVAGGTVRVKNSILWKNYLFPPVPAVSTESQQALRESGTLTVNHSIVEGFTALGGTGNLGQDPLFADAGADNFALSSISPAINSGDSALSQTGYTLDLAGATRVAGGTPDLGAYEFAGTPDSPLRLVRSPSSTTVAPGDTAQFVVEGLTTAGSLFIWEVETSAGVFSAVPTDGTHVITNNGNTSTLSIPSISSTYNGKRYRFRLASPAVSSAPVTLTIGRGQVIYVSGFPGGNDNGTSWAHPYHTIAQAIAAWTPGAEIWVANNTYALSTKITLLPGMKIYGGFRGTETERDQRVKPTATILTGASLGRMFEQISATVTRETVLDSFHLKGGGATIGVYNSSASPTISNCIFENFGTQPAIWNSLSTARIVGCTFRNNKAASIFDQSSSTDIASCRFEDNARTNWAGSAIYVESPVTAGATTTITDCVFTRCTGTAVSIGSAKAVLDRCQWLDNVSSERTVLMTTGSELIEVRNSLIARNRNTTRVGLLSPDAPTTLNNVTIVDNVMVGNQNEIFSGGGVITVNNSIIWGNRKEGGYSIPIEDLIAYRPFTNLTFRNSIIEGLTAFVGNNNLGAHPLFDLRPGYEYRLSRYSPAIDAGNNTYANLLGRDLVGNTRGINSTVDIGAYEFTEPQLAYPVQLAIDPFAASTSRVLTTWSTKSGSLTIQGASAGSITWETLINGQWVSLPSGGDFGTSSTATSATITVAAAADETTVADRFVRYRITGTDFVSPSYTVTTKGVVRYVRPSAPSGGDGLTWGSAFQTISAALAAAPSHAEIWVQVGDYTEKLSPKVATRVYGGFTGTETLLSQRVISPTSTSIHPISSASGTPNLVRLQDTDLSTLFDGFEFNTDASNFGIYADENAGGSFRNCWFRNGRSRAAVYFAGGASGLFEDCQFWTNWEALTFEGNQLTVRRSLFQNGRKALNVDGSVLIEDTQFIGNIPTSAESHMIWVAGNLVLRRSTFTSNNAYGSVLAANKFMGGTAGTAEITDCIFQSNRGNFGNAVTVYDNPLLVERTRFLGGSSQKINGGALSTRNSPSITLRDSYFEGNSAPNSGAVEIFWDTQIPASVNLTGLTVLDNRAISVDQFSGNNGGIKVHAYPSMTVEVSNSIFWGNRSTEPRFTTYGTTERMQFFSSGTTNVHHTLIEGLDEHAAKPGMLGVDPRLVVVDGLKVPAPDSPARNSGDSTGIVSNAKDLFGNARLAESTVDLGAIESIAASVTPVISGVPVQTRIAPGSFVEFTFTSSADYYAFVPSQVWTWQVNTGSGWTNLSAGQIVSQNNTGSTRTLQLAWLPALQGKQVRIKLGDEYLTTRFVSSSIAIDFGSISQTNGTVLALTPSPDSRAASNRPAIALSLSHGVASGSLNDTRLVVHGSQRGRLTSASGKWGTLVADAISPTLTPNVTFQAGEIVEVTLASTLPTALGGTFSPYVSRFSIPWSSRAGSFRQGTSLAATVTGNITGVSAGDLNADGRTDLMFAGDNSAWIYLGDGLGGFTQASLGFAGGWTSFAIADFNGDGRVDFAGSRNGTILYVNTVDATNVVQPVFSSIAYAGTRLLPGDFNGDGRQDLLVLGASSVGGETLLLNTGTTFAPPASGQNFGANERTREAAVADLDHDGDLDFVQVGAVTGDIVVWRNDGTGNFTAGATIRIPNTQTISLADVDRDGWTDLVVAGGTGIDTVHIWRNDQRGNLAHFRSLAAGAVVQLATADYDGDGDNDILAISGEAPDQLWRNDGGSTFTKVELAWTSAGANANAQLAVADLNNDGAPDVVLPQGARPIFWTPGIWFQGFAATLLEGGVKTFSAADFTNATTANTGFTLTGYRVTALPTKGTLKLGGTPVTLNQDLTVAQLSQLSFTSTNNQYGVDSFTVAPRDAGGLSPSGRVTLNITRVVDSPTADAQALSAFAQVPLAITLTGVHPENETLNFSIVTPPTHGTISGIGATRTYTANAGYVGTDTFVFAANDAFGGSGTATVTISVSDNVRTVTSVADSGAGSLRQQIADAVTAGGAWRIVFSSSLPANSTINLSTVGDSTFGSSALLITSHIEIDGTSVSGLTLQRVANIDDLRLFRVAPGAHLVLKKLTVRGGQSRNTASAARGGAIYNQGTLDLTQIILDQNKAQGLASAGAQGGAIYSVVGTVNLTDVTLSYNEAKDTGNQGTGGAIHLVGGNSVFTRTVFNNNAAPTSGADVQLVAEQDRNSTSRWVSTYVNGLAQSRSGNGRFVTTSRASLLPSSLPAYVQLMPTTTITGNATLTATTKPGGATFRYSGNVQLPSWMVFQNINSSRTDLVITPPENTVGVQTLIVNAVENTDNIPGGAYVYLEEFDVTFNVAVSPAPTATDQNIATQNNQPVAFTLNASVASGLTATYTITDQPTKGILRGTAPNLTYEPVGFTGSDEFVYRITDSRGRSASARVRVSLQSTNFTVHHSGNLNNALALAQTTPGEITIALSIAATNQRLFLENVVSTAFGPAAVALSPGTTITIDGTNAPGATIERSGSDRRIFYIPSGARVNLRNITISGGLALGTDGANGATGGNGGDAFGGIAYNAGVFQAENTILRSSGVRGGNGGTGSSGAGGNAGSGFGGAIYNIGGTVTLTDSTILDTGAEAGTPGAGSASGSAGIAGGSAIYSRNGTVTLTRTTTTYTFGAPSTHYGFEGNAGNATLTLDTSNIVSLATSTLNSGTVTINAGTNVVTGSSLLSIPPISNFTISGVGTIPLAMVNGPATTLTATSLNTAVVQNSWLTTNVATSTVKVTTVAPTVGATTKLRVSAQKDGTIFIRDIPVTLAAHVAPVAQAQTIDVHAATSTPIPITLGATYPAGITPTFTVLTQPAQGTLVGTAPNLTYMPASSTATGDFPFTFRVTDDTGAFSDAAVLLKVRANGAPITYTQNYTFIADKNKVMVVELFAGHSGGYQEMLALTYALTSNPSHGAAVITSEQYYLAEYGIEDYFWILRYTPTNNFLGTDTLTYRVTDQYGQSILVTNHFEVMDKANNTKPVITGLPTGVVTGFSTAPATPFANITVVDPESPPQHVLVELPTIDSAVGAYTNMEGIDTYSDGSRTWHWITGTLAEVTTKLRRIGYQHAVPVAPGQTVDVVLKVSTADDFTLPEDQEYFVTLRLMGPAQNPIAPALSLNTLVGNSLALTLPASHPQSLALTYTIPTAPLKGTLSGTAPNLSYTPNAGATGADSFVYRVTDVTGNFASATVSIFINRPPVPIADTLPRPSGQVTKISTVALLANDTDPDGDALTFVSAAATSTQGVALTVADGWVHYPAPNTLTVNDSFTYVVRDARGATATGTVNVVVQGAPTITATTLSIVPRGAGGVTLNLVGYPGRSYTIQVSTDLVTWSTLAIGTADVNTSLYSVDDPAAPADGSGRFYRAVRNN